MKAITKKFFKQNARNSRILTTYLPVHQKQINVAHIYSYLIQHLFTNLSLKFKLKLTAYTFIYVTHEIFKKKNIKKKLKIKEH